MLYRPALILGIIKERVFPYIREDIPNTSVSNGSEIIVRQRTLRPITGIVG
jgi:hypothetical protein